MRKVLAGLLIALLLTVGAGAQANSLTLPAGVLTVGESAFEGDLSLDTVVLPDGIRVLCARAFAGNSIGDIFLPGSLESIADDIFAGAARVSVRADYGTYAFDWAVEHGYIDLKARVLANLRASKLLGSKAEMCARFTDYMWDKGFEPAFIAGMLANALSEGNFGVFENVLGIRLSTFEERLYSAESLAKFREGTAHNYIAHMCHFEEYDHCEPPYDQEEYRPYNGKRIYNDISLSDVYALVLKNKADGWKAQFGLGILQWSFNRTLGLVEMYIAEAGEADTITLEQCQMAELKYFGVEMGEGGSYRSVYTNWKKNNPGCLHTGEGAYWAGYRIARYYEICAGKEPAYTERAQKAQTVFEIMMQ